MSDTEVKFDVEGFKAFGKKAKTCKREQLAQLCWDGDTNTPITIEGRRSGSERSCHIQAREGLACFEKGLIPIGMVHTHPQAGRVTLNSSQIFEPTITSFSDGDIIAMFEKDTGMVSSTIICLSAEDSASCLSRIDNSYPEDISRLRVGVRFDLGEGIKTNRKLTESIIKNHTNSITFEPHRSNPLLVVSSQMICSTLDRYDEIIDKWNKDRVKLNIISKKTDVKSNIMKKLVKTATMKLKYISNASAVQEARQKFGKCSL